MPVHQGRTAVYRLYDEVGRLLYVGISGNPEARFAQHRTEKPWWPQVESTRIAWFDTRLQAASDEREAIVKEGPVHNIHQTPAWREQVAARARTVSPEGRRNRGIGLRARFVMVRRRDELLAQGVPYAEAVEQGALERERYLAAELLASLRAAN